MPGWTWRPNVLTVTIITHAISISWYTASWHTNLTNKQLLSSSLHNETSCSCNHGKHLIQITIDPSHFESVNKKMSCPSWRHDFWTVIFTCNWTDGTGHPVLLIKVEHTKQPVNPWDHAITKSAAKCQKMSNSMCWKFLLNVWFIIFVWMNVKLKSFTFWFRFWLLCSDMRSYKWLKNENVQTLVHYKVWITSILLTTEIITFYFRRL